MKLEQLANLLADRSDANINELVFFRLAGHHWTVFHHKFNDPNGSPSNVRWFNSLAQSSAALQDIQAQVVVQQYFVHPRSPTPVRHLFLFDYCLLFISEYGQPPPTCCQSYDAVYLNLQHDSASCGFWAVYIVFAILLGFNPDNAAAHELDSQAVKELTGTVYASFTGDQVGLPMSLVDSLFRRFQPTAATDADVIVSLFLNIDRVPSEFKQMSRRPNHQARASGITSAQVILSHFISR